MAYFFFCNWVYFVDVFFLWKSWKYNRIIRSKNKVLVRLINEQLSPKENTDVVFESLPGANREEDILSENGMEWAENRELFSKLNETILHENYICHRIYQEMIW